LLDIFIEGRMKRTLILLLALVALAGVTGASAVFAERRPGWPEILRIGTAAPGGTYVIYGDGLAHLLDKKLGIMATPQSTGGPYHNFALVQDGSLELGMTTLGPAEESWNGRSPVAPDQRMRDVRALFPMYRTPFQVVALESSGISRIADLAGKRIGVGPSGGTCASYWPRFFAALGVDGVRVKYANANELSTHLIDGFIDAFAFCAGVPIRVFQQIIQHHKVNLFAFDEREQALLAEKFDVEPIVIPAGTYKEQHAPQNSVAFWNFGIAYKDLPDDFVYELMKLTLDHPELMQTIHPSARETRAENLDHNRFVWFHPGAVRYYRERGFTVREDVLPPEMRGE
jgi:uncharacterized protein